MSRWLPKLRIDLSITLGDRDEAAEERGADHTGYLAGCSDTTTGLGFTPPGPKEAEAWEARREGDS